MIIKNHYDGIQELYDVYNKEIKPLLADVESKWEQMPVQIFNEIRSFNDHIARCYHENATDLTIKKDIEKAKSHLLRIILDCFKVLNIFLNREYVENFEKSTKWINLNLVDDGIFIVKYNKLKKE